MPRFSDHSRGRTVEPARRARRNRKRPARVGLKARLAALRGPIKTVIARTLPVCLALFGLGVVVGAGYGGVRWLTSSERFAVESIRLEGIDRQNEEQLMELLAPTLGLNLFSLDTRSIESRIVGLPWVGAATVERELPNELLITLREHRAAGAVVFEGIYLVDAEGRPFKRCDVAAGECADMPLINGLSRQTYRTKQEHTEAAIRRGLLVAELYRRNRERPTLGEIYLDPQRGVEVVTADNAARIVLGHGELATYEVRLNRFDTAWHALSEEERAAAVTFFIHGETRNHNVMIAFDNRYAANGQN